MITKDNLNLLSNSISNLEKSIDSLSKSIDYLNAFIGNQFHRQISMNYLDLLKSNLTGQMHAINALRGLFEVYSDILEDKN